MAVHVEIKAKIVTICMLRFVNKPILRLIHTWSVVFDSFQITLKRESMVKSALIQRDEKVHQSMKQVYRSLFV